MDTAALEAELTAELAARPVDESRVPFELPPIDGPEVPAPRRNYFPDLCPNDKPQRADWAELQASKQANEREQAESPEEARAMAALISELATREVPAEVVRQQEEFAAAVAKRAVEFDALPAAERAQSIADLKQSMLGGNDEPLQ